MQKKMLLIGLGVAAAIAILLLARPGTVQQSTPGWTGIEAAPAGAVNSPARKTPEEYNDMMAKLSQNLSTWSSIHPEDQKLAVAAVMQLLAQQQQGKISRPPAYYAQRINQTILGNQEVLDMPLDRVLVIMAVMDYDFDNGQDKEKLAEQVLGPAMYAANKARREQQAAAGIPQQ